MRAIRSGAGAVARARSSSSICLPAKAQKMLGAGRKSLAYSLTYRDKNRTLTHDEVNAAHDRIRERLKSELGVELRE